MRVFLAAFFIALLAFSATGAQAARHPVETSSQDFVDIAAVPAYPIERVQHAAQHRMHRQARHRQSVKVSPKHSAPVEAKPEISTAAVEDGITTSLPIIVTDNRPRRMEGIMKIADLKVDFVSGGQGPSIPYNDYEISRDSQGSWGARHGALDLTGSDRGVIPDPQLGRDREGIELHGGSFATLGCVAIKQWAAAKRKILSMIDTYGHAFLHVWPGSVSITPMQSSGRVFVALHRAVKHDREARAERRTKRYVRHRRYRHYARG